MKARKLTDLHNKLITIPFVMMIATLIAACNQNTSGTADNSNFERWVLSPELNEVSGLCWLDSNTLAAVQDEKGLIYILDLPTGTIAETIRFSKDGDYEGIAHHADTFFVLKSNGTVYKWANNRTDECEFPEKGYEFEGLCLDSENGRLLVACKSPKKKRSNLHIYQIGLSDFSYSEAPAFFIPKEELHVSKSFRPSGITMYGKDELCIVSSRSKEILIMDDQGTLPRVFKLNPSLFRQPEGITTGPGGELFIANERKDKEPYLYRYNHINDLVR